MNETDLKDLFASAVAHPGADRIDVDAVLRGGHRRQRARAAVLAGTALAVVVVAGSLVIGSTGLRGAPTGSASSPAPTSSGQTVAPLAVPTNGYLPGMGWMAANLSGTLQGAQATATTACAWVELGDGRRVDVSWPQGFTARMTSPGHLELLSPQGAVVVRTGDQLEIGGGFRRGTTSWCISGDGGPFQAGPITANGVHAYGWPDTDTATATTENPGSTIVLPTNEYVPGLLWPTAARHGTLTARTEGTQTCLYLVQSGGTPVDLSWPAGFAARSADTIEVLAPDGQVVARVGDQLAVGGGGGGPATACAAAGNSFNIGPIDTNGTQTYPSPEAPA